MDMNWYMRKLLVDEHQRELLATAERHRDVRHAKSRRGRRARLEAQRTLRRPQVVATGAPTWHG
jgi:hypothetical protein